MSKQFQIATFIVFTLSIFTFNSCKDECSDVVCYNSGRCDDGECKCPSTFTGTNCEIPVKKSETYKNPFEVTFRSIQLIDFPDQNNGQNWDGINCGMSDPDIYLTVADSSGIIYTSAVRDNCQAGVSYSLLGGNTFSSKNSYYTFVFRLYDKDNASCGSDEYMAGIQGKLYDQNRQLQTSVLFSNPASEISLQLQLTY